MSSLLEFNHFKVLGPRTVVISNRLTGSTVKTLLFEGSCLRPRVGLQDGWVVTVPQDYLR